MSISAGAEAPIRGTGIFPALFVILWSTGFIAAKYGLPYAPAYSFLFFRFVLVAALMAAVALATRAPWPTRAAEYRDLAIVATCVHALYLGGVFVSLDHGMAAGTAAMLVGLQPILTVVIAWRWMHEHVSPKQWAGLALGLAGVYFVVRHKVDFGGDLVSLVPCTIALVAISVGTLYQKKHCAHIDLRSGAVVQYVVCAILYAPLAALLDTRAVQWTGHFVFALAWSVLVLSVGAISLLYWLLRHGAAANVARLFYLVPAVTAVMAYFMFGEKLDAWALTGMALITVGVILARRTQ